MTEKSKKTSNEKQNSLLTSMNEKNGFNEDGYYAIGFERFAMACVIGIYPEERKALQQINVDVQVKIPSYFQMEKDGKPIIDIDALKEITYGLAMRREYRLMEDFCDELSKELFKAYPLVIETAIKIRKYRDRDLECSFVVQRRWR